MQCMCTSCAYRVLEGLGKKQARQVMDASGAFHLYEK